VNACNPGTVGSRLLNNLGYEGRDTAEQGARTPVWLATSEAGGHETGKYFNNMAEFPCYFMEDTKAVERLYEACLRY
jgi:hypothetical protein